MSDAVWFAIVLVGFFVLRGVAATVIFFYLLPDDDRCPNCDAPTLFVQSRGWNTLLPWFRTSWCPACGWDGLLRKRRAGSGPPASDVGVSTRAAQATRSERAYRDRGDGGPPRTT